VGAGHTGFLWRGEVQGHLVAVLDALAYLVNIGKVQFRVHAMRVQVQCQRYQVDVAGALAIAEQA
jgi:hypothetical protein